MYQLRGQRVAAIPEEVIRTNAIGFCSFLNFKPKKSRKKRYDQNLEELSIYGITLNTVADDEWNEMTYGSISGHFDPTTRTISIPESIYFDACAGDRTALFVVMHEIGHLILGHQAALHYSKTPPTYAEDTEWQADAFAEYALEFLGYETKQLAFEFY
ncbi:ImmA/IrrE family metallo-endopeptidase [Rheinheimera sp. YQF-2]|uniref:ImmA/IrrE family metallo-endopeptidase n=1 Tax=Rheinheimera lutimaris TaxID=2740584 RepID=A0A7Y5EIF3_9GAMM|nr:ImmA/IrrE family metallo-endopeptidase [Rheinheimera lutimaris]NRQ43439.1 ImmA/IrrE family metallo-endopeptidase [Rheinheimera lutimaris]